MRVRTTVQILMGGLAVLMATPVLAGSGGTGSTGSTGSTSTSCGCTPTTHQVTVPGVKVTPPSVSIGLPSVGAGSGSASGVSTATSSANASAESNISVTINGSSSTSSSSTTNQSASALVSSFGGGGSGSWSPEAGVSTEITDIKIESPTTTQQVCAAWAAAARQVAIQAVCLDDKSVPHPASQVFPDRLTPQGYEGELFRCIAGARMQYTIAEFNGQADFNHGQTIVCQKGEALWRSANGQAQCKAQAPARDCNERSLLRRFGAGIKVMAMTAQRVCTAYRTETVVAGAQVQSGPAVLN